MADSQPGNVIERDAGNVQLVTARPQRLDQPAIVPNGRKRSGARMLHACCPGVAPNGDAGTRQRWNAGIYTGSAELEQPVMSR